MKRFRLRRTVLLGLAMLFLAVAWAWDALFAIGRRARRLRPLGAFQARLRRAGRPSACAAGPADFPGAALDCRAAADRRDGRHRHGLCRQRRDRLDRIEASGCQPHPGDLRFDEAPADDHAVVRPGLRAGDGVPSLRRSRSSPLTGKPPPRFSGSGGARRGPRRDGFPVLRTWRRASQPASGRTGGPPRTAWKGRAPRPRRRGRRTKAGC